jgi:hypothetical protein
MPSDCEQFAAIRRQALAQLVDLRANPKPSYMIDGQKVLWETYARSLQETVDWCDAKLSALEPFEVRSQGLT